jgi:hypothetical protein
VGVTEYDKLPSTPRLYLQRIEQVTGVPIHMVSTSPDRDHTIMMRHPYWLIDGESILAKSDLSICIIAINSEQTMLTEDGKHLYVSYDEYHNLIEKLAIKVHQSGWQFDTILCLARGGMRPGDILSRIFDKPLAIMSTSSYRADAGTNRATWTSHATSPPPRAKLRAGAAGGRPGRFRPHAERGDRHAQATTTPITELRSAVIWTKGCRPSRPTTRWSSCPPTPGSTSRSKATTPCARSS